MTYNITLTPTACTSETGQWTVLYYYGSSNSSYYPRQIIYTIPNNADLAGAGVNITSITFHGYVRNSASAQKQIQMGFKTSNSVINGQETAWVSIDGAKATTSPFIAIDVWSKSGWGYAYITRTYDGTHALAKWMQQTFKEGNALYLSLIQPQSKSLSLHTGLSNWRIDVTYELLGNIPTTDKTTAKLGETVTTTINRIIADSTTVLNYKIGDTVIASQNIGTATTHAFTVPESAGQYFPTEKTATVTVEAVTSVSGTEYGTLTTSFTATLPEDASPTAAVSLTRVWVSGTASASQIAAYVQKQSGVKAAVSGTAKYGASIASVTLSAEGSEYKADTASATFTHMPFTGSGSIALTAATTDTRGNTGTQTVAIDVLPWSIPTIQAFAIQRATETGTVAIDGTCAKADATASVSSLIASGVEKNVLKFQIRYREIGATDWIGADAITATDISSTISGLLTDNGTVLDTFNDMSGYEFRVEVSDLYATGVAMDQMPTKEQFWDVDETTGKMGFGGDAPTEAETAGYTFYKPAEFKEGYKTYSTTETDTGNKWIDGKPIYRVVLTGTTTITGGQGTVATLPSVMESPVSICGFTNDGTNLNWRPISFANYGTSNAWNVGIYITGGKDIALCYGSSFKGTKSFIIIVEYTKG